MRFARAWPWWIYWLFAFNVLLVVALCHLLGDIRALGYPTVGSRLFFGASLGGFVGILVGELPTFLRGRKRDRR
jgi:hypothetical protein